MSELDIKVTGDNTEAIQSIKDTIALLNTLKSASESVSGGNIKSAMAELKAGINSIRPNPELGKVTEFLNGVAAFKLPKGLASLSERLDDIGTGMNQHWRHNEPNKSRSSTRPIRTRSGTEPE